MNFFVILPYLLSNFVLNYFFPLPCSVDSSYFYLGAGFLITIVFIIYYFWSIISGETRFLIWKCLVVVSDYLSVGFVLIQIYLLLNNSGLDLLLLNSAGLLVSGGCSTQELFSMVIMKTPSVEGGASSHFGMSSSHMNDASNSFAPMGGPSKSWVGSFFSSLWSWVKTPFDFIFGFGSLEPSVVNSGLNNTPVVNLPPRDWTRVEKAWSLTTVDRETGFTVFHNPRLNAGSASHPFWLDHGWHHVVEFPKYKFGGRIYLMDPDPIKVRGFPQFCTLSGAGVYSDLPVVMGCYFDTCKREEFMVFLEALKQDLSKMNYEIAKSKLVTPGALRPHYNIHCSVYMSYHTTWLNLIQEVDMRISAAEGVDPELHSELLAKKEELLSIYYHFKLFLGPYTLSEVNKYASFIISGNWAEVEKELGGKKSS